MARLAPRYLCVAPDLLGLGHTETPPDADWSLRAQAAMVLGFLDELGIGRTHVVGHDHGGAVAQILAVEHADRVDRLVLSDVEAYDNWPSAEERPFAFYVDNGPLLLLWGRLPIEAFWVGPSRVGLPLVALGVKRRARVLDDVRPLSGVTSAGPPRAL